MQMFFIKFLSSIMIFMSFALFFYQFDTEERIIFYPSYGYLDEEGTEWVIRFRIYVYEYRPRSQRTVTRFFKSFRDLNQHQAELFSSRIKDFVVDSESREVVLFRFDHDPEREVFTLLNNDGEPKKTDLNGMMEGELRLPVRRVNQLLQSQKPDDSWLSFRAVSAGHSGYGMVKLVPPHGLSIISDIDDTVKITELPAGSSIVIRNTFYKEYTAAPGMAEFYHEFGEDTMFHYVTGSPWQLYRPLSEFLFSDEAGFPKGTLHMKSVTKNFLSVNTWRDLRELVMNEDVTFDQKIRQISQIMEHFPEREFILIGDSGEADPEVFSEIRRMFPRQIKEIYIRDVVNAREEEPERLSGMNIIPAPTILPGVSQFD
ncbi:MAG: DUF2183 domain-containing protein [Balneolaceae bacterium]|nr:MAG: DUF2183 domain-containing protein [Balneolaceae bacterium]